MELLDVLDESGKPTGKVEERKIVHEKGFWHYHVGVWIMNQKGELLFQQRSGNKEVNPYKWTRTGGHVEARETPIEGIQREVKEEIGVDIHKEDFELINIEKAIKTIPSTNQTTRNFIYHYFAKVNYKIEDYIMQKEEVNDLKYITIEEMEEARKQKDERYTFSKWEEEKFKEIVNCLKKRREEI